MMNDDIAKLLDTEIKRTIEEISKAKTGSDEAKAALIKLDKLHGQRIKELEAVMKSDQLIDTSLARNEENRIRDAELKFKLEQLNRDMEIKNAELEKRDAELQEAKKTRRWRTVLDFLGIAVPTAASGYWLYKGMKFEEEGKVYSSRTSQWFSGITRLFKRNG